MSQLRARHGHGKPTAADVRAALRSGASLQLCFRNGRTQWALSNGTQVPAGVAKAITSADVIATDAGLLPGAPPQTWRLRPTR